MHRLLVGLTAALALTATACDSATATRAARPARRRPRVPTTRSDPDDIKNKLKEHGIDIDKLKNGAWKNWNKDDWLREANDFVNPIIKGLWDPDRMRGANDPDKNKGVDENDLSGDQGVTDATPAPVAAKAVSVAYHYNVPEAGKVFFDSPEGTMVCSVMVVEDPAHPGKSNLVWTAGHCVHAGKKGGWYRNIAFVPSYNDAGRMSPNCRTPRGRRSLRTVVSGGADGRRPRTSGSPRAAPPAARRVVPAPPRV